MQQHSAAVVVSSCCRIKKRASTRVERVPESTRATDQRRATPEDGNQTCDTVDHLRIIMEAVISAIWHRLRHCVNLSGTHRDKPMGKKVEEPNQARSEEDPYEDDSNLIVGARMFNSDPLDALELRKPVLGKVMEALADPNTHLIGIYSSHDEIKDTLLQTVNRRIQRENLFDMVLTGNVTRKPHVNKIQDELAHQLGLTLHPKSKDKRANELIHRIKNEQKILIVLRDLHKGLDLGKVGIPYGSDHTGCKILLTSTNEDVLSNHIHTQKNFMI